MKIISLAEVTKEGVSHNPEITKRVMLRQGDVTHLTNFSQAHLSPGQAARAHRHDDMSEVFFVSSGSGLVIVDGVRHSISTGTCIAIAPGESHELVNTGEEDLTLIYFGIEA